MFTLTTQDCHGVLIRNGTKLGYSVAHESECPIRIRRLTPRECWRLQGFSDEQFDKAKDVCSETQLYKQAGNAVTVNVVKEIGKAIKDAILNGILTK